MKLTTSRQLTLVCTASGLLLAVCRSRQRQRILGSAQLCQQALPNGARQARALPLLLVEIPQLPDHACTAIKTQVFSLRLLF